MKRALSIIGILVLFVTVARAQFMQGFEGGVTFNQTGFTTTGELYGEPWRLLNSSYTIQGQRCLQRYNHIPTTPYEDFLVFPPIEVTAGVNDRLSYYIRSSHSYRFGKYEVVLSTTGREAADFTTIIKSTESTKYMWERDLFDLTEYEGQTVHVAIRFLTTTQNGNEGTITLVDDVRNYGILDCAPVLDLDDIHITNITHHSAEVQLPDLGDNVGYQIKVKKPSGEEEFMINTNTFTLNNLIQYAYYDISVKVACANSLGEYSQAVRFTTLCDYQINQSGVIQGNEGTTFENITPCWNSFSIDGTSFWGGTSNSQSNTILGDRFFTYKGRNSRTALVSPRYNIEAIGYESYKVEIYLKQITTANNSLDSGYEIYANTNRTLDGATLLQAVPIYNSSPQSNAINQMYLHQIDIPSQFTHLDEVYFIVVGYTYSNSSLHWSENLGIDNFKVQGYVNCTSPTNFQTSNIEEHSATLTWDSENTAFEYYLSSSTNTPTYSTSGVPGTGNSIVLLDLEPATRYHVWVRSRCAGDLSSEWTSRLSFKTGCGAISQLGILMGNEEVNTITEIDPCWTTDLISGATNWRGGPYQTNGIVNYAQQGSKYFQKPWYNSNADLISPEYNFAQMPTDSYLVAMAFFQYRELGLTSDYYQVWVNTSPTSVDGYLLAEVPSRNLTYGPGWRTFTYNVPVQFYNEESVYFIIKAITAGGGQSFDLGMDSFRVRGSQTLGDESLELVNFKIFPNPTQGRFTIQSQQFMEQVIVYTMLGQQVLSQKMETSEADIDLSHLPQGTYFVKVTAQGATRTVKVVKN